MRQSESSSAQGAEFKELCNELQETVSIINKNNFLRLKKVRDNLISIDNEFQIKSQTIFRAYDLLKSQKDPTNKFEFVTDGLNAEDAQAFKYDKIVDTVLSEKGAKLILNDEINRFYLFNIFLPAIFGGYTTKSRCQGRRKLLEFFKSQQECTDEVMFNFICSFFLWEPGFITNFHQFITKSNFEWNDQTKCAKTVFLAFERALSFCSRDLHEILSTLYPNEEKTFELLKKILLFVINYLLPFNDIYNKLNEKPGNTLPSIIDLIDGFDTFSPKDGKMSVLAQGVSLNLNGLSTTIFDSGVTGDIVLSKFDFAIISKLNGTELFKECFEPKNVFASKCSLMHVPTMKEFAPKIGIENYPENWKRIYMQSKQNKIDFLHSIDELYYIEGEQPLMMTKVFDNFYIKSEIKNNREELSRIISLVKNYKDFELKMAVNACEQLNSIQCDQEFILTYYKNAVINLSRTSCLLFYRFSKHKIKNEPEAITFDYRVTNQRKMKDYVNAYFIYQRDKIPK